MQESLTNASRHGQASSIQVTLQYDHTQVMLQVEDNGKGVETIHTALGLRACRNA
ncbi:ATP-binding protein [Paenibacillus sp. N3/727]|uniref:ATP-binding protein n=1 Tax=Paenibacillus sp. N3/727 TaxID=2925845 RepID=UPI0032206682